MYKNTPKEDPTLPVLWRLFQIEDESRWINTLKRSMLTKKNGVSVSTNKTKKI